MSNFNNGLNQQGTGTTIMQVSPTGVVTVFAEHKPDGPAALSWAASA